MKIKSCISFLLALVLLLGLAACTRHTEQPEESAIPSAAPEPSATVSPKPSPKPTPKPTAKPVAAGFTDEAKQAIKDLVRLYGKDSPSYDGLAYVVSDFDNTTAIFDITYQCCTYQLEHMAFAMDPEALRAALSTELDLDADKNADWIADIVGAYSYLYTTYGPFTAAGLDEAAAAKVQADPMWKEFATKMRAFLIHVEDTTPETISYVWVLWWYSGMTEQEVYDLFFRSCSAYQGVESRMVTWTSPEEIESKLGVVSCDFTEGISVTQDVKDMFRSFREGGIDVWICSASHVDGVRAAVDAFGLSDVITGVIGMTQKLENGVYVPEYDYENGFSYDNAGNGVWTRSEYAIHAMPGLEGKVTAIENALMPRYAGYGPLAGFMDSTGDFNFCTEFQSLKLVICYNRANRKITEGAGLIAVAAMYQKHLGYDLAKANEEDDTLYILQGRDENGLRTLRASEETVRLGQTQPQLFANEDNQKLLDYAIRHKLTTQQLIDNFCIVTPAKDLGNLLGVDHGHLETFNGYHNIADQIPYPEEAAA